MAPNKKLNKLRNSMDKIDSILVKTLEKRQLLKNQILKLKKKSNIKPRDPEREQEVISKAKKQCKKTKKELIEKIYKEIFKQ